MGKIKKISDNELVGGTQTIDVYPVTSVKAVYDEKNERLDHILNRRGIVNISTNYNTDHITEVLTLSQAIAKVPSSDRVIGFQGKYLASDGWHTIIFTGDNLVNWGDKTKWIDLADKLFNSISNNATFAGIATPDTNPGTPDGPVFYIATQAGIYTNFGGLSVADEEVAVLKYNGSSWSKNTTGAGTKKGIDNLKTSIGIDKYEEFSDKKWYKAGDTVKKNGLLRTFITDHAAGAWNPDETEDGSLKKEMDIKLDKLNKHTSLYNLENGKSYKQDGGIEVNSQFTILLPIKVSGKKLNVLNNTAWGVTFYGDYPCNTESYISQLIDTPPMPVNIPDEAKYVGFTFYNSTNADGYDNLIVAFDDSTSELNDLINQSIHDTNSILKDIGEKREPNNSLKGYYYDQDGYKQASSGYNIDFYQVKRGERVYIEGCVDGNITVIGLSNNNQQKKLSYVLDAMQSGIPTETRKYIDIPFGINYVCLSHTDVREIHLFSTKNTSLKNINNDRPYEFSIINPDAENSGEYFDQSCIKQHGSGYLIDYYKVSEGDIFKIVGYVDGNISPIVGANNPKSKSGTQLYKEISAKTYINEEITVPKDVYYIALTHSAVRPIYAYKGSQIPAHKVFNQLSVNGIVAVGDSLTQGVGSYRYGNYLNFMATTLDYPLDCYLAQLIRIVKNGFYGINLGYGGDTIPQIMARCGVTPYYFKNNVTLYANMSEYQIGTYSDNGIINSYNDKSNEFGSEQYGTGNKLGGANPCYVSHGNEVIEFEINHIQETADNSPNDKMTIRRTNSGKEDIVIKAGTPFYCYANKYKNPYLLIVWIGTNSGSVNGEELVNANKEIISHYNPKNYIVIGKHVGIRANDPNTELEKLKQNEKLFMKAFGPKFFNLRKYLNENALEDAGLAETEEDKKELSKGLMPKQLWASDSDSTHINGLGHKLIAQQLYNIGVINGFWS